MRPSFIVSSAFVGLVMLAAIAECKSGNLKQKYYRKSCPSAERTVRDITWSKVAANPGLAAILLRLQYHDCFVRIITEKKCHGVVSCADIVALATRDAVSYQFKLPKWEVLTGRRDGRVSLASEASRDMPSPNADFNTLLDQFGSKGLDIIDLVTLSGAHTIGKTRCTQLVTRRLYNFTGKGDADPSLDPEYAETLRATCPNPPNPTILIEMDPGSSHSFDSHYYMTLNQIKIRKMGAIGVLTNGQGEIRRNCRLVN
ncbi:peroxidase [Lithospermum erythrorhizon]|uniref:peroxidase n=1 Tax=Lithospermum erythrorhizon TaxID=34254 RepID=A0AAV3RWG1_LITER